MKTAQDDAIDFRLNKFKLYNVKYAIKITNPNATEYMIACCV